MKTRKKKKIARVLYAIANVLGYLADCVDDYAFRLEGKNEDD